MTDHPKPIAPFRDALKPTDGAKPRPVPAREISALEQMYGYFGPDRA